VEPGQPVTFSVTVQNLGPGNSASVHLDGTLSAGLTPVSATPSQGTCATGTSCDLGPLAKGASASVSFNAVAAAVGPQSGTFAASGSGPDPSGANNSAPADVQVQPKPPGKPAEGTPTGDVLVNGKPFTGGTIAYGSTVTILPGGSLTIVSDTGEMHFYPPSGETVNFVLGQSFTSFRALSLWGALQQQRVIVVHLVGGTFKSCSSERSLAKKKAAVRSLWAHGKGHYRTKGNYGSATVRGTWWLTQDYCNGTKTFVRQGVVTVRDFVKKKTVIVKAGESYFASAP
jgi:uncharacterized repeat protein (TIGR01451 family)